MQEDFHYYATYCAAYLAGYDHEECLDISRSAQFVDFCSKTFLQKIKAPLSAATTQTDRAYGCKSRSDRSAGYNAYMVLAIRN